MSQNTGRIYLSANTEKNWQFRQKSFSSPW